MVEASGWCQISAFSSWLLFSGMRLEATLAAEVKFNPPVGTISPAVVHSRPQCHFDRRTEGRSFRK